MKFAFKPVTMSTTISTRLSHALSKSTPEWREEYQALRVASKNERNYCDL